MQKLTATNTEGLATNASNMSVDSPLDKDTGSSQETETVTEQGRPDILANSPDVKKRLLWQAGKLNGLPTTTMQGLILGEYAKRNEPEDVIHIRNPKDIAQQINRNQTQIFHIEGVTKQPAILKIALSRQMDLQSDDPLLDRCDFENRRVGIWFNNDRIWWRWLPAGYSIVEAYIPTSQFESSGNLLTIENEGEALCIDAIWLERFEPGPLLTAVLQDGHLSQADTATDVSASAMQLPAPSTSYDRTLTLKTVKHLQATIDTLPVAMAPTSAETALSQVSDLKETEPLVASLWEPAQKMDQEWKLAIGNALRRRMLPVVQVQADVIGHSLFWELWAQRFGPFVTKWVLTGSEPNIMTVTKLIRKRVPDATVIWELEKGSPAPEASNVQPFIFSHTCGHWGGRTDRQMGTFRLLTWSANSQAREPFSHWLKLEVPYQDVRGVRHQRKQATMLSEAVLQWWMAGGNEIIVPGAEPGGIFFPEGAGKPSSSWDAARLLMQMGDGKGKRTACNVLPEDAARAWADTYWISSSDEQSKVARCAIYAGHRDVDRTAKIRVPVPWIGKTVCTVEAVQLHATEEDPQPLENNRIITQSYGVETKTTAGGSSGYVEISHPLASVNLFAFRPVNQPSAPPRKIVLPIMASDVPPLLYGLFNAPQTPLPSSLFIQPLRTPLHHVDCLSETWQHEEPESDATPGAVQAWRIDTPHIRSGIEVINNVVPWNAKSTRLTSFSTDASTPSDLQTARLYWDQAKISKAKAIAFWIRAEQQNTSSSHLNANRLPSIILGTADKRQQIKLKQNEWQLLTTHVENLKATDGTLPKWLTLWRDPNMKNDATFEFNGFLALSDRSEDGANETTTTGDIVFNTDRSEMTVYLQGESGKPGHWHCRLPFPVNLGELVLQNSRSSDYPFKINYHEKAQIIEITITTMPPVSTAPETQEIRSYFKGHSTTENRESAGLAVFGCSIEM